MARRKRTRTQAAHNSKAQQAQEATLVTGEDILKRSADYKMMNTFFKGTLITCLVCVSSVLLLRINLPGSETVALFLTMLTYLSAGAALFIALVRLMPLKKRARRMAEEHNSRLMETMDEDSVHRTSQAPVISKSRMRDVAKSERGKRPQNPAYKRYRFIWQALLVGAAVIVLLAYYSLNAFAEPGVAPLILLVVAYIPLAGAIFIYRTHLKPLKRQWEEEQEMKQ